MNKILLNDFWALFFSILQDICEFSGKVGWLKIMAFKDAKTVIMSFDCYDWDLKLTFPQMYSGDQSNVILQSRPDTTL